MELTQAEFDALPRITSRTHIRELRAIHAYEGVQRSLVSVETDAGHFRLSRMLGFIATKAKCDYQGSTEGPLGKVLERIAFGEEEESLADSTHEDRQLEEEEGDPLEVLAEELARESLKKLEELTRKSLERLLMKERSSIMAEALAAITKRS